MSACHLKVRKQGNDRHSVPLTLLLSFYFMTTIAHFTSAAVLPPLISPDNTTLPTCPPSANVTFNTTTTTTFDSHIQCVLPIPHPIDPVNIQTCSRVIRRLAGSPSFDTPQDYATNPQRRRPISITRDYGCAISLDHRAEIREISISVSQIVRLALRVLLHCSVSGEGGWVSLERPWIGWIVIVQGTADPRISGEDRVANLEEPVGLE